MKLIDCCMFNGDEIMKMRLEYYKDFFDEFYFTESWYTFSGVRKPFLYCEKYADWFAPYKDKVKFHILEDMHSANAWEQEIYQRNAVVPRILSEHEDAIVFFSDADEFYDLATLPSKEKMIKMTKGEDKVVHVSMKLYQCRFTNLLPTYTWTNAFFLHTSLLKNTPNIHELRVYKNQNGVPISANCITSGWHFSYFMSVNDLVRKLESFSHQELNTPRYKDKNNILNLIHSVKDIFMRDIQIEYKSFDDPIHGYPELFRKYHQKLTLDGQL